MDEERKKKKSPWRELQQLSRSRLSPCGLVSSHRTPSCVRSSDLTGWVRDAQTLLLLLGTACYLNVLFLTVLVFFSGYDERKKSFKLHVQQHFIWQ